MNEKAKNAANGLIYVAAYRYIDKNDNIRSGQCAITANNEAEAIEKATSKIATFGFRHCTLGKVKLWN